MNKALLFVASMLTSVCTFAHWTEPANPKAATLSVGQECYLYNTGAKGFLLGANDWGTRASVSQTLGHKVILEDGTEKGSYYVTNFVLEGGMANQWGYMFLDDFNSIYVDNTKDGKKNNQFTFESVSSGSYMIGLSPQNEEYNSANYPGAYLGTNTTKVGDTRLYVFDPENSEGWTKEQFMLDWIFVSPSDYEAYVGSVLQYNAALALGTSIETAKEYGVSTTAAEEVYNNNASTVEALEAAKAVLDEQIKEAGFKSATIDNPYTVSFFDFEDKDASAWTSSTSASNKGADNGNNAVDIAVTGMHYENWNSSNFTVGGKISTVAKNMPAGVYQLTTLAFTASGEGVTLFLDKGIAPVTATKIDVNKPSMTYSFLQEAGDLEYGLLVEQGKTNWVGLDNVMLQYLGTSKEAYKLVSDMVIANNPDYVALFDEGTISCQKLLLDEYVKTLNALQTAEEPSAIATAIDAFEAVCAALAPNAEAYTKYAELVATAQEWLGVCTGQGEEIDLLSDYLSSEPTGFNGNGAAEYILSERTLTTEQMLLEIAYLDKLLNDARGASLADGDDCTAEFIKNPNFTEEGGWKAEQGVEWPLGTDAFRVFQAWGRVADVHQQISGLQNGIYEMNLQAAYKPDGDEDIRQTYAYINDFETLIPVTSEDAPANSSEEASAHFAAGTYPVKVYGLVTDGSMKIGIANRLRTGEQGILWAGGVTLTFRAKNEQACAAMTAVLLEQVKDMAENYYGTEEKENLDNAVAAAQEADEPYDALKELKKAIDSVKEGTTLYATLKTAIAGLEEAIANNPKADAMILATAQGVLDAAKAAYEAKSYNNEAAKTAIEDVNAQSVAVKLGKIQASEDNPVDMTAAIVNNNFDPSKGDKGEKRIDGWVVEGALNGYKEFSCSFNKGTFDLHQDLSGLPKGKYKVTVHTYYRAGSYEEEAANINSGKDTHLMKLYANSSDDNFETSVMNLSEGSKDVTLPEGIGTKEINGIIVPDGTGSSVKCYAAGLFLNELRFTVGEDGKATIGLRLPQTIGTNDYTVVGEWNLWYMGEDTAPTEDNPLDMTVAIVNNNFDPAKGDRGEKRIDGWVVEGALNGYKEYSCSFNKGTFDLHQDLSGLPKGKYKVTVHTYYRAGSYEEEAANINSGKDTHLMKLYANTSDDNFETSVMNLSEGSKGVTLPEGIGTKEINGIIVPDGTGSSVKCYAAGLFLNELRFTVGEDGKATIGLRLPQTIGTNDYTVVGEWNLWYMGDDAAPLEKSDVTSLIVNNNFDPAKGDKGEKRIDGWVVEGALNGYKEFSCSFNKGTFDLHQDLSGLPEGTYEVTVHTYYRAGSYDEEAANINAGKDTHLMKLYANTTADTYEKSVMNLSEGSKDVTLPEGIGTKEINGIVVPDGTGASVKCYAAGLFLNTLLFYVSPDGKATIGLRLPQTIGTNDYTVVGEWNLYYYGAGNHVKDIETGIERVELPAATVRELVPVAYYSLSGMRLSAPQKGINIIKMSDGSTVKAMIK